MEAGGGAHGARAALCCLLFLGLVSVAGSVRTATNITGSNFHGQSCRNECDFFENLCLGSIDLDRSDPLWEEQKCRANLGVLLFEVVLFSYAMLGLAIVCDDYLCVALERLCDTFMIREDVAGATFMAFGSAAPEIIVNLLGTIKQIKTYPPDCDAKAATTAGIGAILGSGMIAFLVIPAACSFVVGKNEALLLKRRPLLRDFSAYIVSLLLLCFFFSDGEIDAWEGGTMVVFYILYVLVVLLAPKIREEYQYRVMAMPRKDRISFVKKKAPTLEYAPPSLTPEGTVAPEAQETAPALEMPRTAIHSSLKNAGEDRPSKVTWDLSFNESMSEGLLPKESEDEVDIEPGLVGKCVSQMARPLRFLFEWTCVNCEEGGKYERYFLVTFIVAFLWVALFSTIIGAVVSRWIVFAPSWVGGSTFGVIAIAVGAEIPDTIQSVTMAKNGYGSMAVSNAFGSQIINVCIGLGMPWFFAKVIMPRDNVFYVENHENLRIIAIFQFAAVSVCFSLLIIDAFLRRQSKAELTGWKGKILLLTYVFVIAGFLVTSHLAHSDEHVCIEPH
jgi:Ca2+/Na+ antiporter